MKLMETEKIVLTKIDNYIDTILAEDDIYNPYNRYLPEDLKERLINKKNLALTKAFEKYEKEIENVFYRREVLWEYAASMKRFDQYALSYQNHIPDYVLQSIEEYEQQIGNSRRLEVLKEIKTFYENPDFQKYALDNNLKAWSRYEDYQYRLEKNYYHTNNYQAENQRLFTKEMHFIEQPEFAKHRELFKRRAVLWDELRRTGADFSPEKMKELAELERNPLDNDSYKIGIVELGHINAELKIIKADAEIVFPEYYYIKEKQEDLDRNFPERKPLDNYFFDVQKAREQASEGKNSNQADRGVQERPQDLTNRDR